MLPAECARMVSSFGSYAYSENEDTFFIDLYAGGTVKTEKGITLTCETDFPHGGTAKYTIKGEAKRRSLSAFRHGAKRAC